MVEELKRMRATANRRARAANDPIAEFSWRNIARELTRAIRSIRCAEYFHKDAK